MNAILIDIKRYEIKVVPSIIVNQRYRILNDALTSTEELLSVTDVLLTR